MTEEKKENKPKVEEKRISSKVIRRRVAKPPVAEAKPKEEKKKPEKKEAAPKKPRKAPQRVKKKEAATVTKEKKEAVAVAVEEPVPPVVEPTAKEVKVFEEEKKKPEKGFAKREPRKKVYEPKEIARKIQPPKPVREAKKTEVIKPKAEKRVIKIEEAISVSELSQKLGVKASEIIKKLMSLGIMATLNQLIDADAAGLVAQDYGYEVENVALEEETLIEAELEGKEVELKPRAPVVTVMGHVDHGKTSLLDAIRRTNVAGGEAGGITQHIGAYHVHLDKGDITFLDTPGHEAFTAMRARGAKVTDIVVLVVAADDGVMPQTVEAINHAKAAGVPIIVAINKIDLPQAQPDRVKQQLSDYGLIPEEWGGDTIYVEVSAKKGLHIKELLEMILLQAEMLELKAAEDVPARGVIIESKLDKGRGPVATVLVQNGKLRVGSAFVAGVHHGRVRAMIDDRGKRIEEAGPSMPVEILGLSGLPEAGDTLTVVKDEATAKQIALIRERKRAEKERAKTSKISLSELYDKISKGEVKELNVIIKADVHGSIEAVKEALSKLSTDKVAIKVIHSAVGGVNEGDIMLASASNAIVIGFNVRADSKAAQLAETEKVDIRIYNIIYDLIDDVKKAMEGLLEPVIREEVLGKAEIREVFRIPKVGNIAGCYVTEGKILRGAKVRLIRDNIVIYDGKIGSLKRFKEDVKEVQSGYECGIGIEGYNDIKVGDIIEAYELREEAAKL